MNGIIAKVPEYQLTTIAESVGILLRHLNIPDKGFTEQIIKERNMGELLAHFKGWDVQAMRRMIQEEHDLGIKNVVEAVKSVINSKEDAIQQLMNQYKLSEEEAAAKVELYW